jgi:MerR family copper efflux transcriptional regulator
MMTIGVLSRRTGVPVKTLREYEDLGLIYTAGRSEGNYRLFDDDALPCVQMVGSLRSLGLTLREITDLAHVYLLRTEEPIGPRLAALVGAARARIEQRISELQAILARIDEFEATNAAELAGRGDFRDWDPRARRGA